MSRKTILAIALLAGSLGACVNTDVVLSPTNFYGAYTPSVVNYSSARGGLPVEVVGNPFDAPKDELNTAISGWMEGSHFGPHVNFLTSPPGDFASAYRIVLVFDSTQGYTELKLCRESGSIQPGTEGPGSEEPGTEAPVRVHAALCAGESPLTGVSGRVIGASGPADPKFGRLMAQITTNLLPPFNPDRRDNDNGQYL